MTKIAILVGTTLGSSEYIADEMVAQLAPLGHEVTTFL
ncbi:MAG: FMN-binding protein MioC, partial [Shewanella sp.]